MVRTIKKGWLNVKGGQMVAWRNLWLEVSEEEGMLAFYKDQVNHDKAEFELVLSEYQKVDVESLADYEFKLEAVGNEITASLRSSLKVKNPINLWYFKADSTATMDGWMNGFRMGARSTGKKTPGKDFTGWLRVKSAGAGKRWVRRWCVLDRGKLLCFQKPPRSKACLPCLAFLPCLPACLLARSAGRSGAYRGSYWSSWLACLPSACSLL